MNITFNDCVLFFNKLKKACCGALLCGVCAPPLAHSFYCMCAFREAVDSTNFRSCWSNTESGIEAHTNSQSYHTAVTYLHKQIAFRHVNSFGLERDARKSGGCKSAMPFSSLLPEAIRDQVDELATRVF
jgi:hypothetical protein